MPILKVKVRFLDKLYHGKKNDRDAEWPPSPFRLFQAMLAGSGERAGPVLKWLERCGPPQITAPEIVGISELRLAGLKNNGDSVERRDLDFGHLYVDGQGLYSNVIVAPEDRILRTTVRQAIDGDELEYLWSWSDDMPDCPGFDVIHDVVRRVHRLGSSRDFVVCGCEFVDKLNYGPGVWTPGYKGVTLRVPMCGSYDSLVRSFNNSPHYGDRRKYFVNTSRNIRFDEYSYGLHDDNQYIIFKLVSLAGRQSGINPRLTCEVAAWLRHAVCDVAQKSNHIFPGGSDLYTAGHCHDKATGVRLYDNEVARLAYLPLPSVYGPYPDGLIRRVMVAGFGGINHAEHINWVRQVMCGRTLTNNYGESVATLVEDDYSCMKSFVGVGDSWVSVTPVVLPGYDRGGIQTMKLVRRVLEYANVEVAEVGLSRPISGMPLGYKVPEKMRGKPQRFLRLKFNKCVSGPISLGIGRYIGLGLFARG